jgi:hypothetical protein
MRVISEDFITVSESRPEIISRERARLRKIYRPLMPETMAMSPTAKTNAIAYIPGFVKESPRFTDL